MLIVRKNKGPAETALVSLYISKKKKKEEEMGLDIFKKKKKKKKIRKILQKY